MSTGMFRGLVAQDFEQASPPWTQHSDLSSGAHCFLLHTPRNQDKALWDQEREEAGVELILVK